MKFQCLKSKFVGLADSVSHYVPRRLSLPLIPWCPPLVFCAFRTPWKRCCFSGDGEYIVAGSARQHALYIWEKSIGNLVKILHGTRGELLLDVAVRKCTVLSTHFKLYRFVFSFCLQSANLPISFWPLSSGILSVQLLHPSPVEWCPSGLRTKW